MSDSPTQACMDYYLLPSTYFNPSIPNASDNMWMIACIALIIFLSRHPFRVSYEMIDVSPNNWNEVYIRSGWRPKAVIEFDS